MRILIPGKSLVLCELHRDPGDESKATVREISDEEGKLLKNEFPNPAPDPQVTIGNMLELLVLADMYKAPDLREATK